MRYGKLFFCFLFLYTSQGTRSEWTTCTCKRGASRERTLDREVRVRCPTIWLSLCFRNRVNLLVDKMIIFFLSGRIHDSVAFVISLQNLNLSPHKREGLSLIYPLTNEIIFCNFEVNNAQRFLCTNFLFSWEDHWP